MKILSDLVPEDEGLECLCRRPCKHVKVTSIRTALSPERLDNLTFPGHLAVFSTNLTLDVDRGSGSTFLELDFKFYVEFSI